MATTNPFTSAQAPNAMSLVAPDLAVQQTQLARQQQIADLLRQQSLTSMGPTESVGGFAIKKSPLEAIAKMAQALGANYAQKNIDTRNLDLATSMRQRMADILGGSSSNPSGALAAGAAAQPSTPGPDGQMVNQGGVGPTNANAARLTTSAPPASNFSMGNLLRGSVITDLGGPAAGAAYYKQYEPTDLQRNDTYLGISPDQSRLSELAKRLKAGNIPPTRLGNAGYYDPLRGFIPLPANAPPGFINVPSTTDKSGFETVQIGAGPAAVRTAAKAKTAGEGEAIPYAGVDAQGNPLPVTNRTAAATQGSAPPVVPPASPGNPGSTAPQPGDSDRPAIYASEIAKTQDKIANPAKYMSPNDLASDPGGVQFVARAKNDLAGLQREVAKLPNAGAQPGKVYAAPPLGAVKSTDAAQTAPADTMKASYAKLQGSNSTAQNALDVIDKMLGIAAKKNKVLTAGVLGTNQSFINPDAAEYEKQRANLITQLAAQNGTNGTDAGRALTGEAVPDFGKPKAAIADGLGTLRNQTVVQQLKANLLTPVYQSGDSKKYTTLENEFDQHISPSMVPLLTMPAGKARAEKLQAASKDPAMRAKLNWAAENGLLK